jgi:HlyD family secretion protein
MKVIKEFFVKKRLFWIAGFVIIVSGLLFWQLGSPNQAASAAEEGYLTEPIVQGSLTSIVGATGTVRANQTAILAWQTSGTVAEVRFGSGEHVPAGETLAALEALSLSQNVILAQADLVGAEEALADLLDYEVASAQAQIEFVEAADALKDAQYIWQVQQEGYRANGEVIAAAEADLVLAANEVKQAESAYNKVSGRKDDNAVKALARSNLSAARQHYDSVLRELNWYKGHPSETDQALLDAEVALAEAQYNASQEEWAALKDGPDKDAIAAAEARVLAAQSTLDSALLVAPFSGEITEVMNMPGDQVSGGSQAFRLDDFSRLLVDVEVSEVDINQIALGQTVVLTFDAIANQEFEGEVVEVARVGESVQGAVRFNVVVEMIGVHESVKPAMTAAVNIFVSELENVLQVPNRAVRFQDGERVVYLLENGQLRLVNVELGAVSDDSSQVLGGELAVGDLIVLNPPAVFEPGMGDPGDSDGARAIFGGG